MSKKLAATGALVAGSGLVATTFALVPTAAFAAADCGIGTEVSDGLCEVVYDVAGSYTFDVPAGVSKIAAILVGAGGGSLYDSFSNAYGGGGGDVIFVDSLPTSGSYAITVGAGGLAVSGGQVDPNAAGDGEDTTLDSSVASGGLGAWIDLNSAGYWGGGDSGNGNAGSASTSTGAGGGAGESAPDCNTGANPTSCPGGAGVTASTVAAGSELFPSLLGESEYGIGGTGLAEVAPGSVTDYPAGHGGDALSSTSGDDGNDGTVVIRWKAALPDTGMSTQNMTLVAGGALLMGLVAGGLMIIGRRLPSFAANSRVKRALRDLDQRLRRLGS